MLQMTLLPGLTVDLFPLLLIAFVVGSLSGFMGCGGGFLMTPALVIFGFPANLAVGTSLAWLTGNAVIGALRHRLYGNTDTKLGLAIALSSILGVEAGTRFLNWARDIGLASEAVLSMSVVVMLVVGAYMLLEASRRETQVAKVNEGTRLKERSFGSAKALRKIMLPPRVFFSRSEITMSLWVIALIGFNVGVLSGFLGVGGGFIMLPAMIYLLGLGSFMAVGTSLFVIIFSSSYGAVRHAMSGNVVVFAAFVLLLASSTGVLLGAALTRYVSGRVMRFVMAVSVLLCAAGSVFKLLALILTESSASLDVAATTTVLGSIGLLMALIGGLCVLVARHKQGRYIPRWVAWLMTGDVSNSTDV